VIGRNGMGKTSLLQTLAGFLKQTGEIYLDQQPLSQWSRRDIARRLGILLENQPAHFPRTVLQKTYDGRYPHLSFRKRLSEKDTELATQALNIVGLDDAHHRCITQLSSGETQRVNLATLLLQDPNIYLLDEPTSHLDLNYISKILAYFQTLASEHNKAVVMVMHDINLVNRYCDKTVILCEDGVILTGETQTLLTHENLYHAYQNAFTKIEAEHTLWLPE